MAPTIPLILTWPLLTLLILTWPLLSPLILTWPLLSPMILCQGPCQNQGCEEGPYQNQRCQQGPYDNQVGAYISFLSGPGLLSGGFRPGFTPPRTRAMMSLLTLFTYIQISLLHSQVKRRTIYSQRRQQWIGPIDRGDPETLPMWRKVLPVRVYQQCHILWTSSETVNMSIFCEYDRFEYSMFSTALV